MIRLPARKALRLLATFVALYVALCLVISMGLPRLAEWHFSNCTGDSPVICRISSFVLSYWWIALLPTLAIATALGERRLARQR